MAAAKTPEPLPEDDKVPTIADDLASQRDRLADLLGRMLARHWLREGHDFQEQHEVKPTSPDPQ